jgi:hypothetical protein
MARSERAGKPMKDAVKFAIGSVVFHRADGKRAIVTGILFRPHGVLYAVTYGVNTEAWCYDFELSQEREFMLNETE